MYHASCLAIACNTDLHRALMQTLAWPGFENANGHRMLRARACFAFVATYFRARGSGRPSNRLRGPTHSVRACHISTRTQHEMKGFRYFTRRRAPPPPSGQPRVIGCLTRIAFSPATRERTSVPAHPNPRHLGKAARVKSPFSLFYLVE